MLKYIYFLVITTIITFLCKIYNKTIIKFIKKYPALNNLALSTIHHGIEVYTYFQVKYNK